MTFVNRTGLEIGPLFFSHSNSPWGPDLLGVDEFLADGEEISFYVAHPSETDSFDVRAVDSEFSAYDRYELGIGGSEGIATVNLTNRTGDTISFQVETFEAPIPYQVICIDEEGDEYEFDMELSTEETEYSREIVIGDLHY